MEVEIIRAFERLLIVVFSGTSIILGWHLFKIGIVSPQSGELTGKGFKLALQKIGPGVFFCAFGSIVLSIALVNGLVTVETTTNKDGVQVKNEFRLANTIQESDLKRITTAINTLDLINLDSTSQYESNRNGIRAAIERLRAYRDILATKRFSEKALQDYFSCKENNNGSCSLDSSYKDVEAWLTDTLLQEP